MVPSDKERKIMVSSKAQILVIFVTSCKPADKLNVKQDNGTHENSHSEGSLLAFSDVPAGLLLGSQAPDLSLISQ